MWGQAHVSVTEITSAAIAEDLNPMPTATCSMGFVLDLDGDQSVNFSFGQWIRKVQRQFGNPFEKFQYSTSSHFLLEVE